MSRLFDGADDVMSYALPVTTALNDALTLLLVAKILAADGTWLSLLEGERAGGGTGAALGRRNNNEIYFANSASLISGGSITAANGWAILAITRTAGAATDAHRLPIGGTRTTTALGALADGLSLASGVMRIGGNDDFAHILVKAAAFWDGIALTTAQLDGILSAKTTQSILDLSPTWAVDDGPTSNEFANDLVGTTNRTAITGTTSSADDPDGWVSAGEGGAPTFTGTAAQTLPVLVQAAAGTHVPPAFAGTAAQTLPAISQAAAGASEPPTFTAAAAQTLPAVLQAAAGTATAPSAGAAQELPALTQAATGTSTPPVVAGTAAQTLPALVQQASSAEAPFVVGLESPVFDAGSVVDLVPWTLGNASPWAHERILRRAPGRFRRTVSVRPREAPVASAAAGANGVAVFGQVPDGRYWIVGEREGVVRRVARTIP